MDELRRRSISAVALVLGALGMLFAGREAFAVLVLVVGLVMSWEWGRIVRSRDGMDLTFCVHALTIVLIVSAAAIGQYWIAVGFMLAGALALFAMNVNEETGASVLGAIYVGVPATALILLRNSDPYGLMAVLFVFSVVWAGDTAAFLGGRSIGGAKLYPSISPNKTWAGLLSALLAALVVGWVFWLFLETAQLGYLLLCAGGLGIVAQLGDLAESALKRLFRVKDASGLIPGHGGFMDRMDGIVAAGSVAVALGLMINSASPARALLYGM